MFGAGASEIVECSIRHADNVSCDEGRALGSRDLGVFEAILPLIDRPSVEIVFRELREDLVEVDLPIPEGAVTRGAFKPGLVAGIEALFAGRAKLGVFHVKALDALMVDVDERDIVQPLLDEMARVIVDVASGVITNRGQESLERFPVENVLARVQLKPYVDADFVEGIKDGGPTPTELIERGFNQMVRTLRPWIAVRPASEPVKVCTTFKPRRCEAFAAVFISSTAQAWRALGFPCTLDGAKASQMASYAECTATSWP